MVVIRVDCVPVAQPRQRHRVVRARDGKVFVGNYTPSSHPVNAFKVACQIAVAASGAPVIDGPCRVDFEFIMPRPKRLLSRSSPRERIPFARTPDRDNLLKATQDALNGLLWRDDALIYDGRVSKWYAAIDELPHVLIEVF